MQNLVTDNLSLVKFVMKKMNIYDCNNYEDYFQIGVIGLINASKQYNEKLRITFSTYAYICIKNEILKYMKKNQNTDISLEETIYDEITIEDTIQDKSINILESIIINESVIDLNNILKENLSDFEYSIIKMTFGIGCKEYKQKEISEILNIPQYKVSRIKNRLLIRLRDCINNLK